MPRTGHETRRGDRGGRLIRPATVLLAAVVLAVVVGCSQTAAGPSSPSASQVQTETASQAPSPVSLVAVPTATAIVSVQAPPPVLRSPLPTATGDGIQRLASGEFLLPAVDAFGAPGFHEVLIDVQTLPNDLSVSSGDRLILSLRDLGRPDQSCSREHPLSGCATVDWSDFDGRAKVPSGGVFEHSLTLRLASGDRSFFLSESGSLNDTPDSYKPG